MLPKVSVLIVTYLEQNQRYLDLCLRSVKNLNYPKELLDVLVLSSGEYEPDTMRFRAIHSSSRLHFPEGVNYGVNHLESSKHILILNDDVILHRDSLRNMVESIGDDEIIMGPVSNCDQGWRYHFPLGYVDHNGFNQLEKRFYRYDDLAPVANQLMNDSFIRPPGLLVQSFICFYAVLIPRKVWSKVGGLDPLFKTGCDDLDYCLRCKQMGISSVVQESAMIWHFGGTTADVALTPEIRNYNDEYFTRKWGVPPSSFH